MFPLLVLLQQAERSVVRRVVPIEIEDIKAELEGLEAKLKDIEDASLPQTTASASDRLDISNVNKSSFDIFFFRVINFVFNSSNHLV